ncbi:MAG: response regulator transcription factor [Ardenticatenaceae bacterium]|nr:response regulator transcription factor [Ardenticatenaceae bacterium]
MSNSNSKPTILIGDDHSVVRSGLKKEIERLTDYTVVGEAINGHEVIEKACELRPDVIILDINMPEMNGIEVTNNLNDQGLTQHMQQNNGHWPPSILILSAHSDPEYVYSLFASGAKGYLLKDEPPEEIVNGIRQILEGNPAISLPIQKILLRRRQEVNHPLSVRELEVLKLMARGFTNDEIAEKLVITTGTVKNHVTNIYHKIPEIRSRSEAVAWAWMNRLVSVES